VDYKGIRLRKNWQILVLSKKVFTFDVGRLFEVRSRATLVVMLPEPLRGTEARKNSTETQQSNYAPRSGPEVKNESSAKYYVPERLRYRAIRYLYTWSKNDVISSVQKHYCALSKG